MLILVFIAIHVFFFVLYMIYQCIRRIRFPDWTAESEKDEDGVPLVMLSDNHKNYYKYVFGSHLVDKIIKRENDSRAQSRKYNIDPEGQRYRSFTRSTSQDLSSSGTSTCWDHVKYEEIEEKPQPKVVAAKSKGKFGPNTKPKGGVKKSCESQNIETNVCKSDEEPHRLESGELTTKSLPRNHTRLHHQPTTSVEPQTSTTESGAITTRTAEAEIHFLNESSNRRRPRSERKQSTFFSSLDSVKSLSDDEVDHPLHYKPSFYGAPSADQPFHSYIDPWFIAPHLEPETTDQEDIEEYISQSESFARSILWQYYSDDLHNLPSTSTGMMNPLEDDERKIIIEFCHLLEKSKQLFNGLRELPQYGHRQWSLYFGRTFDIYTKIWKFQQTHRAILDSKYGMKRWQIGEIASKIGQLYYHFYLRTSETAYLNEAFSFYYAIRGRCYYTKANKEDKCELMVKKLRYYARFIVVCLLLNKMKLVKELIKELERQIIEYGNTYDPDDQVEWTVVVDEIKAFIHAEPVVSVVNTDNQTMILSHRLSPLMIPPVERSPQMNLSLQEILIVGSSSQQVKFSELTMDMFRMLQTLEREPSGDIQHIFDESPRQRFMSTPNAQSQEGVEPGQKMPNPHKYLLFKPSPNQMLVYLSSAINDLPPNGALLLYISADGYVSPNGKHADDGTWGYDLGGLITTSKNDIYRECSKDPKSATSSKYKELQCFYPGDLHPCTRRPLFLIVDSDNSYAFQNIPRHFNQPLVILMSPLDLPPSYHDPRRQGSLFTLFLHSPLEGLCYCCDLSSVSLALWDRAQMLLDTFMAEASSILVRSRIDPAYISFMGDDFFRLLLVRFVFCEAVLRLHRLFRGRTHHTRSSPVLPDELFEHPTLVHIILDIANVLQIRNHIHDPSAGPGPGSGPN